MSDEAEETEETPTCSSCLHWQIRRPGEGWCARRAPVALTSESVAHWPQTHSAQSCGEHVLATAGVELVYCADCRFWRRPANGFEPTDREDKLAWWWEDAGYCHRQAPVPSSEPGPRTFWPTTHATDRCAEGVLELSPVREDG